MGRGRRIARAAGCRGLDAADLAAGLGRGSSGIQALAGRAATVLTVAGWQDLGWNRSCGHRVRRGRPGWRAWSRRSAAPGPDLFRERARGVAAAAGGLHLGPMRAYPGGPATRSALQPDGRRAGDEVAPSGWSKAESPLGTYSVRCCRRLRFCLMYRSCRARSGTCWTDCPGMHCLVKAAGYAGVEVDRIPG